MACVDDIAKNRFAFLRLYKINGSATIADLPITDVCTFELFLESPSSLTVTLYAD